MTCAIVPDFVLRMFEKEIAKVIESVVMKMCDEYEIDLEDAKAKLKRDLNINLDVIDEDIEQVKIIKKHQTPSTSKGEPGVNTCEARLFIQSELMVRQCSRSKMENCKFCKTHQKQYDSNALKWGTIHDDKPEEISTAKLKQKVRKTLY
jgi:hypothetical protein